MSVCMCVCVCVYFFFPCVKCPWKIKSVITIFLHRLFFICAILKFSDLPVSIASFIHTHLLAQHIVRLARKNICLNSYTSYFLLI